MPWENRKPVLASMHRFLAVFLVAGALLAGLAGVYSRSVGENLVFRSVRDQERYVLNLQQQAIVAAFDAILGDLAFLAGQNELQDLLDTGSGEARAALAREFRALSRHKGVYDQIRWLDERGVERVRVNYNGGRPAVVPDQELQDKAARYYFQDTFSLDRGAVFVSPLDLNIEHGVLERPFKPMLRFGTPVFDSAGNKRGVILLNYLAQALLNQILDIGAASMGRTMLLNSEGYWLLSETPEDAWGFMFEDRVDQSFAARHPKEWAAMLAQGRGQMVTETGMFTFAKVMPLFHGEHSSTGSPLPYAPSGQTLGAADYFWVLVSFIPTEVVAKHSENRPGSIFFAAAGLFLVVALVAWIAALALTGRRIYRAQLASMAHYDGRTGLPNRILFHDRLRLAHSTGVRYGRGYGVLRLDLEEPGPDRDGTGGEMDGDTLVRVAEGLRHFMRRSDTVARLGRNAFAVILGEADGLEGAAQLGERVLAILRSPHCLGSEPGGVSVSVGVALYPDHADTPEGVVLMAEQALAVARTRGGNCSVVAQVGN